MDEARAAELEAADPLRSLRDEFLIPHEWAYLAGNSLGLQPRGAQKAIEDELAAWAQLGVEGWFESREPWLEYAGSLRGSVARLVGAAPDEVAVMNTLTVNLHLLLASFYRPTSERFRIVIEDTGVLRSLGRSRGLVSGSRWRVIGRYAVAHTGMHGRPVRRLRRYAPLSRSACRADAVG